jgi:SET domain-containing protein
MVIEYAGELIRSTLTDKRERYYDSKGIGCYMFKIDENLVVDATMSGTAARFINHSCDVSRKIFFSFIKTILINICLFLNAAKLLFKGC